MRKASLPHLKLGGEKDQKPVYHMAWPNEQLLISAQNITLESDKPAIWGLHRQHLGLIVSQNLPGSMSLHRQPLALIISPRLESIVSALSDLPFSLSHARAAELSGLLYTVHS